MGSLLRRHLSAAVLEARPSGFQRMSPTSPTQRGTYSVHREICTRVWESRDKERSSAQSGTGGCLAPAKVLPLSSGSHLVTHYPPGSHGQLHMRTRCAGVGGGGGGGSLLWMSQGIGWGFYSTEPGMSTSVPHLSNAQLKVQPAAQQGTMGSGAPPPCRRSGIGQAGS